MSAAKKIPPLLHRLRRFGQMLLGSPKEVDAIIKICLQSAVDDPHKFGGKEDKDSALFHLFLTIVNDGALTVDVAGLRQQGLGALDDEFLTGLIFIERQAFLLRYIEEFSRNETSEIMGVTKDCVKQLEKRVTRKLKSTS